MWEVKHGCAFGTDDEYDYMDHCKLAYRPMHSMVGMVFPLPFARRQDCERAVAILNRECPVNSDDPHEIVRRMTQAFGSRKKFRQRLITECCQW